MKYKVYISEEYENIYEVEANSCEEAQELAELKHCQEEGNAKLVSRTNVANEVYDHEAVEEETEQ